ncbi:MAG: GntR family transcriptional regulator [Allosphingosinicella sp.]|uniref:GntR family transcriptional regulator n=1 Tax=Allosphingosinicella sp. TaxID=2823234 RepID=UPI00392F810C
MSPGPTFDRIYHALRDRLAEGCYPPGGPLEPAAIGDELHSSITPVRDALHRLVGEGLVAAPRHDGFRVPSPAEAELRDLYLWNLQLLELALRRQASAEPSIDDGSDLGRWAAPEAEVFARVAAATGSGEHLAAVTRLNDRLAPIRRAERDVVPSAGSDAEKLAEAETAGDGAALRKLFRLYHRRRVAAVPRIVLASRRPRPPA